MARLVGRPPSDRPGGDAADAIEADGIASVREAIEWRAERHPERPFLEFEGEVARTYGELDRRSDRVARALDDLGVGRDDPVCVVMPNRPVLLDVWFGVAKSAGVYVPLNYHHKGEGLAYNVNDSGAEVAVVHEDCRENYETARDRLEGIDHEVLAGADGAPDGYASLEAVLEGASGELPARAPSRDDTHSILYTSGTTGLPKGVLLPEFSYLNTPMYVVETLGWTEADKHFTTLPLFHSDGQQDAVMANWLAGKTLALERWFSASSWWEWIDDYGATTFNYIGAMVSILADREGPEETPARMGIGGGGDEEAYRRFQEWGVELVEGYGLTETANYSTFNPPDAVEPGSIGPAVDFVEVEVVDEHDDPLPPGETGEIVIRPTVSNTIMKRYHGHPEKTVEAWGNLWFHTGDLGYKDEDGYFYFVDRKPYAIRVRGENVSSAEVERAIEGHDAVAEAAVVGVEDEIGDTAIKAYVLPKEGATVEPREVVERCNGNMAYFKVPRYVEVVDEFPRTATERIEKYKLKERGVGDAWDREDHDVEIER